MTRNNLEAIYTPCEAAEILRMTPGLLDRLRLSGEIGAIKHKNYIRYTARHLREFVHSHECPRKFRPTRPTLVKFEARSFQETRDKLNRPNA